MFVKNFTGNMAINVNKIVRVYILGPSYLEGKYKVMTDVGDGVSNTLMCGTQEECEQYLNWFMTLFGVK